MLTLSCLALLAALIPAQTWAQGVSSTSASVLSSIPNWVTDGQDNGVDYGISVASAGDVNGDGYDDEIIGAPKYLVDGARTGSAFVFLGGPLGLSKSVHRQLANNVAGSLFGGAVAPAGDVNGDGFDDVLVGAHHFHATIGYDGAAYLYLGSAGGLSATPAWSKIGPMGDAGFGFAVAGAGDVNQDGFDDVLIGAPLYSEGQNNEGGAFLYLGSAQGLGENPDWQYQSHQVAAQLGYAVAGVGDLNKDGFADVAVTAPYMDVSGEDDGLALIFFGSASGLDAARPDWQAHGDQEDARFGASVAAAGDVDGNQYPDLIVGARGYDGDQADVGAAFLYYNSSAGLSPTAGWQAIGSQQYSGFGIAVAGLGDPDQDGFSDVAIGAPRHTIDQPAEGCAFVFHGGPTGPGQTPDWTACGDKAEAEFGYSLAGAGDVNADGKPDLVVGAPLYKRDERIVMGRAFVYHGRAAGEIGDYYLHLPAVKIGL